MQVTRHPRGGYRFIEGIPAYSAGIVADAGHEVAHVTLSSLAPWRGGFDLIDAHLAAKGHDRQALCAIQLRCPAPYTFGGFREFNARYRSVLDRWDVCVDGVNPLARTNVAPLADPPSEPCLYAFSYVRPAADAVTPTFVVAGSGEYDETDGIHRAGESGVEALRAKAAWVMREMTARLEALGVGWAAVNRTNVYTVHDMGVLSDIVLGGMGRARAHGLHWFDAFPPIEGIEFEMDVRAGAVERHL
jgi:hypothetical protein